jgi:hypothetical protein
VKKKWFRGSAVLVGHVKRASMDLNGVKGLVEVVCTMLKSVDKFVSRQLLQCVNGCCMVNIWMWAEAFD